MFYVVTTILNSCETYVNIWNNYVGRQRQVHRAMCICPTATMEVMLEFTPLHRVLEV